MKKYANLNEQVLRMKKLALINEAGDLPAVTPQQSQPLTSTGPNLQQNQENPEDNTATDAQLTNAISLAVQRLPQEMPAITREVTKNIGKPAPNPVATTEEQLHEVGVLFGLSALLTAPKITEMLGQAVKQFGIKTDINLIRKIGEKLAVLGKNWEHLYLTGIEKALNPFTKGLSPGDRRIWAERILMSMILAAGITSAQGAVASATHGELGISALESGLGGIKATELASKIEALLPKIVSSVGKEIA